MHDNILEPVPRDLSQQMGGTVHGSGVARAYRHNLETDYGAHPTRSGFFTVDLGGLVAQKRSSHGPCRAIATTARVHELLQTDHGKGATFAAKK